MGRTEQKSRSQDLKITKVPSKSFGRVNKEVQKGKTDEI